MAAIHGFRYCVAVIASILLLLSSGGVKPVSGIDWGWNWPTWDDIVYREKVTVKISNTFNSQQEVTVHCESWQDDLGEHRLQYGEEFHFSFVPDIFEKTTFTCKVDLDYNGQFLSTSYDLYWAVRDIQRCGTECDWLLNEQGLMTYFPNEGGIWKKMFNWGNPEDISINDG